MDWAHPQPPGHAAERGDAAVRARPLEAQEPGRENTQPRAPVALDAPAGKLERRDLRDELERELLTLPVVVDDGDDLAVAELAHPVAHGALFVAEPLLDEVEVGS